MPTSLPLTAFERFMLLDDSDEYPRLCFGRILLEGQLDRPAFESALVATLKDHWLIRSTVSNGLRKRWVVCEPEVPPIQWLQGSIGGPLQSATRINLHRETGMRLVVVQDEMHVEITFIIHHACCDGVGGLRVCEDVLCHYATLQAGATSQVASKSVEAERNYERISCGLTFQNARSVLPKQIVGVLGALQYCFRNPKPLGMPKPAYSECGDSEVGDSEVGDSEVGDSEVGDSEVGDHSSFPATTVLECTRDHTVALRKAARNCGVSQNELLARDFFLALWDWQKSEGSFDESAWLRMMIPINMRDASSRTLPAMNAVSSVFLDRRGCDSASEEQLLGSIREEMEVIRKFDLRYTFLLSLWLMQCVPGVMRFTLRRDSCTASAVFTNTGKFLRRCRLPRRAGRIQAGNLSLLGAEMFAPIRPNTAVALCVLEYENRLKYNLKYDHRVVSKLDAERLLQILHQRTLKTALG